MDLDTSPQIDARNAFYKPRSPEPLPELQSACSLDGDKKHLKHSFEDREKQANNMDVDDLNDEHGGVSLTAEPDAISVSLHSLQSRSTDVVADGTDLYPNGNQTRPMAYARSPLMKILEEASEDMDLDDDDSLPELEETCGGGAPISPASLPGVFSNRQIASNSTANFDDTEHGDLKGSPHYHFLPTNESQMEIETISYSTTTTSSASTEKPDRPEITISWFVRPPADRYERDLCERVCEQVAILHGFQEVLIRSHIITHHTWQTRSTARHIYVDPYLIATFTSTEFSPYKGFWETITQTADVHVGPQEKGDWANWGLWRKGGKDPVVWL